MEESRTETGVKTAPAESTATVSATASPASTTSTSSTAAPAAKKSNTGKYIIFGCLALLILCCCVMCGLLLFAPSALGGALASATGGRDDSLTRIESADVAELEQSVETKEEDRDERVSQNADGDYEVEFTEEEVLYIISDSLQLQDPNELGLDLEDNYMKLEVGLKGLLESAAAEGEEVDTSNDLLNDLYFSAELSNSADGKTVVVDSISTGNSLIDSLLPADMKTEFENSLNEGFQEGSANVELKKIEFKKDKIVFTYSGADTLNYNYGL